MTTTMIITIDGPAGAGKSTVAKAVAKRLGLAYLDTGAMYRAITLRALQQDVTLDDQNAVANCAKAADLKLTYAPDGSLVVTLDGRDVSQKIRSEDVSTNSHYIASNPQVRDILVDMQRKFAADNPAGIVTEGRDQGSVVFPDAVLKIYLVADPAQRAKRRYDELISRGESADYDEILNAINQRDTRDSSRAAAPLVRPAGSVELDTTPLTIDEVVEKIAALAAETEKN